jgi:deoxycytidylate deaminase
MAATKARITQSELTRYLKAYQDAGIPIARSEISRDGKVIIYTASPKDQEEENPWDQA